MMFASRKCLLVVLSTALLASMQVVCSEDVTASPPSAAEIVEDGIKEAVATASVEPPTCNSPTCEAEDDAASKDKKPDESIDYEKDHPYKIPDFTHGGIVVYFHLYKTGGSSVTELIYETKGDTEEDMKEDDEEKMIFINNREDMTEEDIVNSVTMVKNRGVSVFYNFHVEFPSTMYPTIVEAAPVLDAWRDHADNNGVPFFVATVIREPLGHSLSFFNFFHVAVDEEEWSPFTGDLEPTEENFLKTFVPNRMCHLLFDDAHGILEAPSFALKEGVEENLPHFMDLEEINRRNEPAFCNIDAVRKILFEGTTFDYVGVTERLSTHILPMFMQIVFLDHSLAEYAVKKKEITELFDEDEMPPLKKHALSEATKEMVARESSKDQELYEEARDRFAHWPKFLWHEATGTDDDNDNDKDETNEVDDSETNTENEEDSSPEPAEGHEEL